MQLSRTVTQFLQKDTRHYHVDSHHGTRHPAVCESGACRCCPELVALIGPRASIARPPVRLDCVRLASENRRRAQRRARRVPCVHVLLFSDRASSALLPPPSKKNRAPTGRPERSSIIAPASDQLCCPLAQPSTALATPRMIIASRAQSPSAIQPPGSCEYSTTSV